MVLSNLQLKLAGAALGFTVLLLATSASFFFGITQGENNINARWQKEKAEHSAAMLVLQGKINQQELAHRQESTRITDQLRKTETDYEKAIADLGVERAHRLRLSAERAAAYQRLAQGGSAQSGDLARHAAELDLALEQGRGLVGELTATLRQRDAQLKLLGTQLTNDRRLLGAE